MTAPTDRIAAQLSGPSLWHTVEHLEQVTSTNDVARERVESGARPGLIVVADHQTRGRGRAGRDWQDPGALDPSRSLLSSYVVGLPVEGATLVPLAAGLAVADGLRRQGVTSRLKWPNDVLVDGRKCAGILVERHTPGARDGFLVIGIGVNVDWRGVPRDDTARWTSAAEHTERDVDRFELLADLMRSLAAWLTSLPRDPQRLLLTYREDCASIGQHVRVDFPDGEQLEGVARDLDTQGRLVVDTDRGAVAVNAGDVTHLPTDPVDESG